MDRFISKPGRVAILETQPCMLTQPLRKIPTVCNPPLYIARTYELPLGFDLSEFG